MKVAAYDLGSNTFLLLVCEIKDGLIRAELHDDIETTRLGQGVAKNKMIAPEALERADKCLARYSEIVRKIGVDKQVAVATSAARDSSNQDDLLKLGRKYGIEILIIPGELEAQLTFLGATYDRTDSQSLAVIDVGGGSTEILFRRSSGELSKNSINVGSVRLTEMFVTQHPVPSVEVAQMRAYCQSQVKKFSATAVKEVVAVAGTPVTLARIVKGFKEHNDLPEGEWLSKKTLDEWTNKLAQMSVAERQALTGMEPKRADVIFAGCVCLQTALEAMSVDRFSVSKKGVRHGAALWAYDSNLVRA